MKTTKENNMRYQVFYYYQHAGYVGADGVLMTEALGVADVSEEHLIEFCSDKRVAKIIRHSDEKTVSIDLTCQPPVIQSN